MNMTLFDNQNNSNSNKGFHTLLFQIHYSNFNCYFDNGIISPVKYIEEERTENDIQSQYPNYLVLTNEKYLVSNEEQLFFEIVLTQKEYEKYLIEATIKDVFLYTIPIPVSRISNIFYVEKAHLDRIKGLAETGGTSYLPPIFSELPKNVKKKSYKNAFRAKKKQSSNFDKELLHFDKVMGMFAFIKNADLYYGQYSNYSKNYFSALSVINSHIKNITQSIFNENYYKAFQRILRVQKTEEASKSDLLTIIYKDEVVNRQFVIKFIEKHKKEKEANELILEEIKKQIKDPLQKKKVLEKLNKKELYTFFEIAYLSYYGQKVGTGTNKLKNAFAKEVTQNRAEVVLALFGIYYGYKSLDPYDVITLHNYEFEDIIDTNTNVKFKLDNRLDYVTIESIYQFAFYDTNNNGSFDYLISPDTNQKSLNSALSKYKNDNTFEYSELTVIDKEVISIRKIDLSIKIEQLLERYYGNTINASSHIFPWIMKQPRVKILVKDFSFDKHLLVKIVRQSNPSSLEYLLECIEFDIKHQNQS